MARMSRLSRPAKPANGSRELVRFGRDGRLRSVPHCSAARVINQSPSRPFFSRFTNFDLRFAIWSAVLLCLLCLAVRAGDLITITNPPDIGAPPPLPTTPPLQGIPDFIAGLITKAPWLATLIFSIGGLRLVLKPIMLGIEWYTKQTANPDDDVAVLKFEAGPIYKWLAIGLDYISSIKLPVLGPSVLGLASEDPTQNP